MKCRRFLSVLLALFMVLALLPIRSAFAMQVFVELSIEGAANLTLEVEPSDSIDAVKEKIQTAAGCAPARQLLVYAGKELKVGHTLADYNIQEGSTLYLEVLPADSYTVTLLPGDGTGAPVTYACPFSEYDSLPTTLENAEHLHFYQRGTGCVGFKLNAGYCPDSFTAPDKFLFDGWDSDPSLIAWGNPNETVTAKWKVDQVATYGPINDIPKAARSLNFWLGGVKWRVIGQSDSEWLLISADVLGSNLNWNDAMAYSDTVYNGFSDIEQAAVLSTSKTDHDFESASLKNNGKPYRYYAADVNDAKLFSLSAAEATYYFNDDEDRKPGMWWLRSIERDDIGNLDKGGFVAPGGKISSTLAEVSYFYARPAFRFDPSTILFRSLANNGKPTPGSGLTAYIMPTDLQDCKLTLIDPARSSFTANQAGNVCPGGTMSVLYRNAPTGENEYISAMIFDGYGSPIYYASVPSLGNGTMHLTLPTDLTVGGRYTLRVFSEQQNGDCATDYASAFQTFVLNTVTPYTITFRNYDIDNGVETVLQISVVAEGETPVYTGETPTISGIMYLDGDPYGFVFDGWSPEIVPATEDTIYTAQYREEEKNLVTFFANGGSGTMADDSYFLYEGVYTLPKCGFTPPDGMAFKDWLVSWKNVNGTWSSAHYIAGATLRDLTTDLTVTAQWQPMILRVSPDGAGTAAYDSGTFTATANVGYTFKEWDYYPDDSGAVPGDYNPFLSTDNPYTPETVPEGVYEAVFTRNAYSVTVQANDAARGTASYSGTPETGRTITLTATANDGYVFKEWRTVPEGIEINNKNKFTMPPCDVTVTAVFVPELTDGYYLIGPDWTVGAIDTERKFAVNPANTNEYMLSTTLTENDEIKVVHVTNKTIDAWYPDGLDNQYHVDAAHAGLVNIYFQTSYNEGWSTFGGYFYIEAVTEPAFVSQSLLLSGQIGVRFYVSLPEALRNEHTKVSFSIKNGESDATRTDEVTYSEGMPTRGDCYGFTFYVNTIEMADEITATLHYDGEDEDHPIRKTYQVMDYFTAFDASYEADPGRYEEKVVNLVRATADLGHYLQPYLQGRGGWSMPEDHLEMEKSYAVYNANELSAVNEAVAEYALNVVTDGNIDDFRKLNYTINFKSKMAIHAIVQMQPTFRGELTATASYTDGEGTHSVACSVIPQNEAGTRYMVEIPNVMAHELSRTYVIVLSTDTENDGTLTMTCSALSYIKMMLNGAESYDSSSALQNAMIAFYRYSKYADVVKGNPADVNKTDGSSD